MRSTKCDEEGFVRKRHAKGGGFGPVQHVAVSQLTHFVTGAIINSRGSSDADTIEQLLFDMDPDAHVMGDTNHEGAWFCIDRGYSTPEILRKFKTCGCNTLGTIQRQKTVTAFPYTFDHPEDDRNVPSEGIPVSLYSRRGTEVAMVYRGFQHKQAVLLRSTAPMLKVPLLHLADDGPPVEEGTSMSVSGEDNELDTTDTASLNSFVESVNESDSDSQQEDGNVYFCSIKFWTHSDYPPRVQKFVQLQRRTFSVKCPLILRWKGFTPRCCLSRTRMCTSPYTERSRHPNLLGHWNL